jgi:hypothetical protein
MTKDPNQKLRDDEAARREYIRATFGDDALEGLATDQPSTSRRPSSAQTHARERAEALADLHREERDRDLAVAQALESDRAAFERATADPGRATEQDRIAAHRHALRQGLVPRRSSIDRLIAQGERQRRITRS